MQKVIIGISGGIDSAVASALYADILGAENITLINMPVNSILLQQKVFLVNWLII